MNVDITASNEDILKSYYFARLLDHNLIREQNRQSNQGVSFDQVKSTVEKTEKEFGKHDIKRFLDDFNKSGWSLQYIYLDNKKNRFTIEKSTAN